LKGEIKMIKYEIYKGNEECQVKFYNGQGYSAFPKYNKCKNIAEYSITNGYLRCKKHFKKWLKSKEK
jgi:hypothetical protein